MTNKKFENTLPKIFGQPTAERSIVVLSPHLDDAVWSLGGLLNELVRTGYRVEVITVFSQSTFVYDELISSEEATALRKSENILALRKVGVHREHCLDIPEGVLRDRALDSIFDAAYALPAHLAQIIGGRLEQLIPQNALVLAPSGFGEHMDHIALRDLVAELPYTVIYYEDMPYAARTTRVDGALSYLHSRGYRVRQLLVDRIVIDNHLERYKDYISQRKSCLLYTSPSPRD